MNFIANYFEFTEDHSHAKISQGIYNPIDKSDKEIVVAYFKQNLKSKASILTCVSKDYVTNSPIANQSIIIFESDGFTWTNEVAYHFEKYDLKLNDDFIQYVLNNA